MSLRRPILLRWQPYMDECLEMLENSPDAYPSDKTLCQWIKLQHIAEEVSFQFSMDDPTGSVALSDTKTQYALKGFKGQLDDWRKQVTDEQYGRKFDIIACGRYLASRSFRSEVLAESDMLMTLTLTFN
jgi:hypothetical protein